MSTLSALNPLSAPAPTPARTDPAKVSSKPAPPTPSTAVVPTDGFESVPATQPRQRAEAAWNALVRDYAISKGTGEYAEQPGSRSASTVWPFGQALVASLDHAALTGNREPMRKMFHELGQYAAGNAYTPGIHSPASANHFYDDNSWLGLAMMQRYAQCHCSRSLANAKHLFDTFISKGQSPLGGILWCQHSSAPTRNTCSTAPAIELAMRLYQATRQHKYLAFAEKEERWLSHTLRAPDGMYWDNVDAKGNVTKDFYTYNQGTPIGAEVMLYKATHEKKYLQRAEQTAKASLAYFTKDDRLWQKSPAFNAIYFRNLLELDAIKPDPKIRATLDAYVNRLWTKARDPKTGLFTRGGVGSYGKPGDLLDQAGVVQLFSLAAMGRKQLSKLT